MYLVMLCGAIDDLPVKVFADDEEAKAREYAKSLRELPENVDEVFGRDITSVNVWLLVKFDAEGNPVKLESGEIGGDSESQ